MSTQGDPKKDEYLELEKKVGAAESELAAELADADNALDAGRQRQHQRVGASRAERQRKVTAPSRKHDSGELQS